jgi:hypothetical protein
MLGNPVGEVARVGLSTSCYATRKRTRMKTSEVRFRAPLIPHPISDIYTIDPAFKMFLDLDARASIIYHVRDVERQSQACERELIESHAMRCARRQKSVTSSTMLPLSSDGTSRLRHGGILFLEPVSQPLRALHLLVDASHDAALFAGAEGLALEAVDTVVETPLNEVGVHLTPAVSIISEKKAARPVCCQG